MGMRVQSAVRTWLPEAAKSTDRKITVPAKEKSESILARTEKRYCSLRLKPGCQNGFSNKGPSTDSQPGLVREAASGEVPCPGLASSGQASW